MDEKRYYAISQLKPQKDINVDIPGLKMPLEPHQKVAVAVGVLAETSLNLDFLGAGKTVTSVALDLRLRHMGLVFRSLVLCQDGKKADWQNEYNRFTDIPTFIVGGDKSKRVGAWTEAQSMNGVTIAHYEAVRGDMLDIDKIEGRGGKKHSVFSPASLLAYVNFDLIILDEITLFKTYGTALHHSLRFLMQRTKPRFRYGLSATPIQKSLEDLHSVMDVIKPGLLGDRDYFQNRYCIYKQFTKRTGPRLARFTKCVGFQNEQELKAIMEPYYIRREKSEVYGEKLKHIAKIRQVELTGKQKAAYKFIAESADRGESRQNMFLKFLEQEKTCDTMQWFDPKATESAKLDDIRELLNGELVDEKVVIFSKHKLPLRQLAGYLKEDGIRYVVYTGDEKVEQREINRDAFQNDPTVRVMLVTQAAEMGYDLHAAHYMIFINHIYNPARMDQLRGRIDRPIVQKSNFICTIHYICKGTFEEKIIPRLYKEADLMRKIFDAANSFAGLNADVVHALDDEGLYNLVRHAQFDVTQTSFTNQTSKPEVTT